MKLRYLWAMAASALILQGCTKGPAEKAYLDGCGTNYPDKICQCSYNMLSVKYGDEALDSMHHNHRFPTNFGRNVTESLLYCRSQYE